MDRNDSGNSGNQGGEDNSNAVAHVHNAQQNRDALAEENRRVEASAGNSADQPVRQQNDGGNSGGGMGARGTGSEDATQARANVESAAANRDALAEESRRIQESAPEHTRRPVGDTNNNS
ncbi:MAG TPA: hypothetical protein VE913_24980 [Longimicrobium sp.]|nr:hypothetical protein [Longimicrobium sp.]